MDWIDLAEDGERLWGLVNVLVKCGEFLDYLRNGHLLKKGSAAWSYQ
jgi:hypothetical protein